MSELVPTPPGAVALPAELVDRAHHYATTSKASATLRAYRADWTDWTDWLKPFGGKLVAAPRAPGSAKFKSIEAAPGRYVKAKA